MLAYEPLKIDEFCAELRLYGINISRTSAWEVLRRIGDIGLARDALLQQPRPAWLAELVGPAN